MQVSKVTRNGEQCDRNASWPIGKLQRVVFLSPFSLLLIYTDLLLRPVILWGQKLCPVCFSDVSISGKLFNCQTVERVGKKQNKIKTVWFPWEASESQHLCWVHPCRWPLNSWVLSWKDNMLIFSPFRYFVDTLVAVNGLWILVETFMLQGREEHMFLLCASDPIPALWDVNFLPFFLVQVESSPGMFLGVTLSSLRVSLILLDVITESPQSPDNLCSITVFFAL